MCGKVKARIGKDKIFVVFGGNGNVCLINEGEKDEGYYHVYGWSHKKDAGTPYNMVHFTPKQNNEQLNKICDQFNKYSKKQLISIIRQFFATGEEY